MCVFIYIYACVLCYLDPCVSGEDKGKEFGLLNAWIWRREWKVAVCFWVG